MVGRDRQIRREAILAHPCASQNRFIAGQCETGRYAATTPQGRGLMWHGIHLLKVPTLARKVRVIHEWNRDMLFPADIAHPGFSRTKRKTAPLKTIEE